MVSHSFKHAKFVIYTIFWVSLSADTRPVWLQPTWKQVCIYLFIYLFIIYLFIYLFTWFFETGFLCVALAVLELTL